VEAGWGLEQDSRTCRSSSAEHHASGLQGRHHTSDGSLAARKGASAADMRPPPPVVTDAWKSAGISSPANGSVAVDDSVSGMRSDAGAESESATATPGVAPGVAVTLPAAAPLASRNVLLCEPRLPDLGMLRRAESAEIVALSPTAKTDNRTVPLAEATGGRCGVQEASAVRSRNPLLGSAAKLGALGGAPIPAAVERRRLASEARGFGADPLLARSPGFGADPAIRRCGGSWGAGALLSAAEAPLSADADGVGVGASRTRAKPGTGIAGKAARADVRLATAVGRATLDRPIRLCG